MFQAIELKLLELFNRTADYLKSERGQTTSEYVAVTAVAVAIALTVIFLALKTALTNAVADIAFAIENFVTTNVGNAPAPPAPPPGP